MKIESLAFEALDFSWVPNEPIFQEVDFNFPMNQIIWVQASSGEGRSTLLQLMSGLQLPQNGEYRINGQGITEMTFEEFLPYRLQIGYGFDFGGLLNNRTLLENLILPLQYHKVCSDEQAKERARDYMNRLGILKHQGSRPALVPGGVRKMICLLRALILHPQVLLLDDPSVGLGQEVALKYFDLINELREQNFCQTIYMSSFDEKLMNCIPHKEIWIDAGQLHDGGEVQFKKAVSL